MKKLNKKGFAITTLIYGLSIMGFMTVTILLSIMSSNKANNSALVKTMNDELNNFGRTSVVYTSSSNYTVPTGQSGYYKLEAIGESGYASGLIYLNEGDQLSISISSTLTSASIVGESTIINVGTGGNIYVVGRAEDFTHLTNGTKYACLNGQVIKYPTDTTNSNPTFKISKISETAPDIINTAFTDNGSINTLKAGTSVRVIYKDTNGYHQTSGNDLSITGQITDIYYSANTNVRINEKDLTKTGVEVRTNGSINYDLSLYQPNYTDSTTNSSDFPIGNYTIALAENKGSYYNSRNYYTLSTSSITLNSMQFFAWMKTNTTVKGLIKYNNDYFARTVRLTYYKGQNQQKWRIEPAKESDGTNINGVYRISEIENYKPFELNEKGILDTDDGSSSENDNDNTGKVTGKNGPKLVTGIFRCLTELCKKRPIIYPGTDFNFTEVNDYYGNPEQQWILESVGNGYYRIRTNLASKYYLNCEIDNSGNITESTMDTNTCYLESEQSKASVFKITKVDM